MILVVFHGGDDERMNVVKAFFMSEFLLCLVKYKFSPSVQKYEHNDYGIVPPQELRTLCRSSIFTPSPSEHTKTEIWGGEDIVDECIAIVVFIANVMSIILNFENIKCEYFIHLLVCNSKNVHQ